MKQLNVFESRKIRDLFVNSFVDQTTERYKMIKEIDSQNVSLYLWDTLLKPFTTKVNYYSAINHLQNSSNKVFLMMDIQRRNRGSEETQFNLYLKKHNYEREAVFELPASEVAELYRIDNEIHTSWMPSDLNLLEDIYVFDESFKWLIVFTHEQVDLIDTNYLPKSGQNQTANGDQQECFFHFFIFLQLRQLFKALFFYALFHIWVDN